MIGARGIRGEGLQLMDSEDFKETLQGAATAYFTLDCSSEERKRNSELHSFSLTYRPIA